jgi:hypothetical protein
LAAMLALSPTTNGGIAETVKKRFGKSTRRRMLRDQQKERSPQRSGSWSYTCRENSQAVVDRTLQDAISSHQD